MPGQGSEEGVILYLLEQGERVRVNCVLRERSYLHLLISRNNIFLCLRIMATTYIILPLAGGRVD